jgi:hypothetical protein
MKAILINPKLKTITEVDYKGTLESIYDFTGCDCVDGVRLANGDILYVDDEGLYKPELNFFILSNPFQPLAGNGLVVGLSDDGEGRDIGCKSKLDDIINQVTFISIYEAQRLAWK